MRYKERINNCSRQEGIESRMLVEGLGLDCCHRYTSNFNKLEGRVYGNQHRLALVIVRDGVLLIPPDSN